MGRGHSCECVAISKLEHTYDGYHGLIASGHWQNRDFGGTGRYTPK
jgi:hypothetical protein